MCRPPAPGAARSRALGATPTTARAAAPGRPARAAPSCDCARAPPRRRSARACAARSPISPARAPCRPGRTSPGPSGSAASASRSEPPLGDRRAPRREDQRHAVAREVDQVVDRVPGADIDVDHHRLRPAGHRVGAMRHRDREVLVRHEDRARQLRIGSPRAARNLRRSAGNPCPDCRRNSRRHARRAPGGTLPPRSACAYSARFPCTSLGRSLFVVDVLRDRVTLQHRPFAWGHEKTHGYGLARADLSACIAKSPTSSTSARPRSGIAAWSTCWAEPCRAKAQRAHHSGRHRLADHGGRRRARHPCALHGRERRRRAGAGGLQGPASRSARGAGTARARRGSRSGAVLFPHRHALRDRASKRACG